MKQKQRLYFITFMLATVALAAAVALYALRDNLSFFYTPMQVDSFVASGAAAVAPGRVFRIGGLVVAGSLMRDPKTAVLAFDVTDGTAQRRIHYAGVPPDLFRVGQGIVATGRLNAEGVFIAETLLARHDENYRPPELENIPQNDLQKEMK